MAALAIGGALVLPAQAQADETERFTGTCRINGVINIDDSKSPVDFPRERQVIRGEGLCTGTLINDGQAVEVTATPIRIRAHGRGDDPIHVGEGSITFIREAATIQFSYQLIANSIFLEGWDGGTAEGSGIPTGESDNEGTEFESDLKAQLLSG